MDAADERHVELLGQISAYEFHDVNLRRSVRRFFALFWRVWGFRERVCFWMTKNKKCHLTFVLRGVMMFSHRMQQVFKRYIRID